jgi:uncharacterized membrane protein
VPLDEDETPWAYDLLALLLVVLFVVGWVAIDYAMEQSFNLHIWDVGANYVLTQMTAPPGLDYGHLRFAPQNVIYLLFTPLVRALPDPMTLVYTEDVLMGLAGLFIYLIAAHVWQSRSRAVLVEGLFLFSFALFGAPFYPNHYEILLSVFFPAAYLLRLKDHDVGAAVCLILAAMTSSLGAVTSGLFVVLLLGPRLWGELRGHGLGVWNFLREQRWYVLAGLGAVAVFALPFAVNGVGETLSYAHLAGNPSSPNLGGGANTDLLEKIVYLGFLFLPFVFVIRRSRYVLLALPYVALVLVSGSNHYSEFDYQYTYMVGGVLFIAWIEALRFRYGSVPWPRPAPVRPTTALGRVHAWRLPERARRNSELAQTTAIIVIVGFFALPFSPGNLLTGSQNWAPFHDYDFPSLVTVTAYDQAVTQMEERVPISASVLIQENMPEMTTRAVWYEPGSYNGEPVQYALADPSTFWFDYIPPGFIGPYPTKMITWVNELYDNRTYGIAQEYEGAILFREGYQGPIASFEPYRNHEPGVAFIGPNQSEPGFATGAADFTNASGGSLAFRTEGLFVIPPGSYNVTYWLASSHLGPSDHLDLGLWRNGTSPTAVATTNVTSANLSANGAWTAVTLRFSVRAYVDELYFGAYDATWNGTLSLRSVFLNQTSAY